MTAIRPERLAADRFGPEKTGPETFAPKRKAPEKLGEIDQAAANAFEGEIREFVRRDVAFLRRQRSDAEPAADPVSDNLNSLIRRVSGASMDEIDRVILELQGVRDMLRSEGERVSREIAGYASLSHASMTAMKVIGDSLTQWKSAPDQQRPAFGGLTLTAIAGFNLAHDLMPRTGSHFSGSCAAMVEAVLRLDLLDHDAGRRFDQQHRALALHVFQLLHGAMSPTLAGSGCRPFERLIGGQFAGRRQRVGVVGAALWSRHDRLIDALALLVAERLRPGHDRRAIEDVVTLGEFGRNGLADRADRPRCGAEVGAELGRWSAAPLDSPVPAALSCGRGRL